MSGSELLKEVALRPWPMPKKEELGQQELLLQVTQLTEERGHLREITEKSLQEQINAGSDTLDGAKEGVKEEKKVPSMNERLDEIYRVRMEMIGHLEWARFATNNLLDICSLILSADPNKRSAQLFSPGFRQSGLDQGLPFGSFGVSRENHEQHVRRPEEEARIQDLELRQELVAKGSRMEALESAVDDILKAAKSFEKEARRETKYWEEIVSISNKGWPIQRLRQNARHVPFGVRYGLPEASDHFKARGFAPLRMDKDGSIILDPALTLKPKTLRVRISENGKITGTSYLPEQGEVKELAIERSIQLARDSLFEEELFHEMSMETRQLVAYGVEFRDSVISIDAPTVGDSSTHRKLLVDCIPRDENMAGSQDHSLDWFAQHVAEGLRLLLCHEHNMRLYRRTQLPPPLTARKREKPPPPILRTLLAMFSHLGGVDSLYTYLEAITRTMNSAGLDVSLDTTRETSWKTLTETLKESSKKGLSATDQLLEIFMKPFNGKATLTLPSLNTTQTENIVIVTRTIIGQPIFGTEHKLTIPSLLVSDLGLFQQLKFSSVDEVKSYLNWILSLHLAHRLLKNEYPSRAIVKGKEARITISSVSDKKSSIPSKDVMVEVEEGELKVSVTTVSSQQASEEVQSYVWNGKDGEESLKEKVKGWVA